MNIQAYTYSYPLILTYIKSYFFCVSPQCTNDVLETYCICPVLTPSSQVFTPGTGSKVRHGINYGHKISRTKQALVQHPCYQCWRGVIRFQRSQDEYVNDTSWKFTGNLLPLSCVSNCASKTIQGKKQKQKSNESWSADGHVASFVLNGLRWHSHYEKEKEKRRYLREYLNICTKVKWTKP